MSVLGKIAYGLQVAGIGLVVVFTGLGILIATIYMMGYCMEFAKKKRREARARAKAEAERKAAEAAAKAAPVAASASAPVAVVEADEVTDSELIAVIAAAIAAFDNSGKALVVRKVRRVTGWNRQARAEQVYRF